MTSTSRLPLDPETHLPSIQNAGDVQQFLRGAAQDEDSRALSESMGQVATRIEAIVAALQDSRRRDVIAPQLVDLLTVLRGHRMQVLGLGLPWRGLYEYPGYLHALNNFRVLIGQWLLGSGPRSQDLTLTADDFGQLAWRTLGEGILLIDMYDQWMATEAKQGTEPPDLSKVSQPQVERALQWWKKLGL